MRSHTARVGTWLIVFTIFFMSSLMHAGPNTLVLAIVTTLFFIASYVTFTRQEIR